MYKGLLSLSLAVAIMIVNPLRVSLIQPSTHPVPGDNTKPVEGEIG